MPDEPCGLLIDWGGVLTSNVFDSFAAFCSREGLPPDRVRDVFRTDPRGRELLVGLEEGTLPEADFERDFAALLGVDPERLIERMMHDSQADLAMIGMVRRARDHGILTGLISNSWGVDRYDADDLAELFDGVVISGRVGMRKPAPEMYAMGAQSLHLEPGDCVYVDDLPGNLKPARAMGMTTILHHDATTTIAELSKLFGVDLGGDLDGVSRD
jgi:epoxide hydrolase-like predicted phosphatase